MRIRRMTIADVPQVEAIEQSAFSRPWSQAAFETAVKDANAVFLVAEETSPDSVGSPANVLTGYIGMYASIPEGEITNVAVAEHFRGRGIGKALVKAMQQEAALSGVNRIFLEVRYSNAAAISVYVRLGFEEMGIRKNFYDFPKEDARVMRWENN